MEEEFISLAYFSLQLTGDMFVLYNTYENIIVSLDKAVRIWGVPTCEVVTGGDRVWDPSLCGTISRCTE